MKPTLFALALIIAFSSACDAKPITKRKRMYRVKTAYGADVVTGAINSTKSVVKRAMLDLGVTEGGARADEVMQKCGFRNSRRPWCCAMLSDWLITSGYRISRTASVSDLERQLDRTWKECDAKEGAVVIFEWSHVGLVVKTGERGFWSLEANSRNKCRINFHPYHRAKAFYTT